VNVTIQDREQGASVDWLDGVARLEEKRDYLVVAPGCLEARLAARRLEPSGAPGCFLLPIGHWIGDSHLHLAGPEQRTSVRVEVLPRAEKASELSWAALLDELHAWLPGVTAGLEGGGHGAVDTTGSPAPGLALALLPLIPELERAVHRVVAEPRERELRYEDQVRMHTVRRIGGDVIRWLARHPDAALAAEQWSSSEDAAQDPWVLQSLAISSIDHQANRYVAWLLRRIDLELGRLGDELRRIARAQAGSDTAAWCAARESVLSAGLRALQGLVRCSFLSEIKPEPPSPQALLTVLDDPVYSRVHTLARRLLSPRFRLHERPGDEVGPSAAVRPSYDLYELWTFLAVQRQLSEALPGWSWRSRGLGGLSELSGTGAGAAFVANREDGGRIELLFNKTFKLAIDGAGSGPHSLTGERRPDLVLTWRGPGEERAWLCLDAKYRVRKRNLADAFTSAHVYRDALRWSEFGGRCRCCYLLAPAALGECVGWYETEFLQKHGFGVIRLTPGESTEHDLGEQLCAVLGI